MKMKLLWSLLVTVACVFGATNVVAKAGAADSGAFTTKDKEFYLTPEELLFIRPGMDIEILDVVIPADNKLEVTYSLQDPAGMPLDPEGINTPGAVDVRFILAHIPMGETQKVRLASLRVRDSDGTLTTLSPGVFKFKFAAAIDFDMDTTHTLGLTASRDLQEFDLDRYADNAYQNWVPSGMVEAAPRQIVTTETCNRCHDPLGFHSGGSRKEVDICTNCHNPTGNTRFEVLIHGVHAATESPRNPPSTRDPYDWSAITYPAPLNACETCHVGGTPTGNFPLVASPAAALVCDGSGKGETTLNWDYTGPVDIYVRKGSNPAKLFTSGDATGSAKTGKWVKDGTFFDLYEQGTQTLVQSVPVSATVLGCVGNAPAANSYGAAAAQHTNWLDNPTRAVCGQACHDVDFTSGEDHVVITNDEACVLCHYGVTGNAADLSVQSVHQLLVNSPQFPGALVEIVGIEDTNPGDTPTVTFSSMTKNGPLNPNGLNRLRFALSGPNEDFSFYAQETVGTKAVADGNLWTYTFATAIPADAEGSFTVSVEGRADATVNGANERDVIEATLMEFAVTGDAEPRRMVVDDEKCESCHVNLSLHGGGRNNANYCVTCHMPEAVTEDDMYPNNYGFKYMIHRIHKGEEATNPYGIVGHGGTVDWFDEVLYPGDLRNCGACHIDDSEQIPLPDGVLASVTPQELWDLTPVAAACIGCHDSDDASIHAYTNSTTFGEACSTCHGPGKELSVDKAHAR